MIYRHTQRQWHGNGEIGDTETWRYGEAEIWRNGDMEIWIYGDIEKCTCVETRYGDMEKPRN